jgi:hypothetical protein
MHRLPAQSGAILTHHGESAFTGSRRNAAQGTSEIMRYPFSRGPSGCSGASLRSKSLCWFHLRTFGQDERKDVGTLALAGVCLK